MWTQSEDTLHRAVWAYHDALQRRDGLEARLRRGDGDVELRDRSLRAADAVTQARIALYRLLVSEGWSAPPRLQHEMAVDVALLQEQGA